MLYNKNWDKATTPSQLLRRAADIMEERGHAKGVLMVSHAGQHGAIGSVCAIGALLVAAGSIVGVEQDAIHWSYDDIDMPLLTKAQNILASQLQLLGLPPSGWGCTIPNWNNDPNRSGDEVIAKMREVADKFETVAA